MTSDMDRATKVFGLTHGADLPHVSREFTEARAEERARVLDEVDAAIRRLGSWEFGGLHYIQNSAVYGAINDVRRAVQ